MASKAEFNITMVLGDIFDALDTCAELIYRYKRLLLSIGCGIAWFFSVLEVTHCSFLGNAVSGKQFGLFSRSFSDQRGQHLGCIRYAGHEVDDFDSLLRAGRAFGVFTVLYVSTVALSTTFCAIMTPKNTKFLWNTNKFLLAAAIMSQMLTLLAAGSQVCKDNEGPCELVGVGILGIFNVVVLLLLCVTFWHTDPPESMWLHIADHEPDQQTTSQSDPNCIQRLFNRNPARFRLVFTALVFMAMALSAVVLRRCTFLMVNATGYGPTNIASGLGLYTQAVQVQGSFVGCVAYPASFDFDPHFKAARFFATVSTLLVSGALFISLVSLFRKQVQRNSWIALRTLLPSSSFCLLLSTISLRSDSCSLKGVTSCRLGSSGVLMVFIVLLLAFLSVIVWNQSHPASCVLQIKTELKNESDIEQQSSKDDTVIIGNPRLFHKHEPIMEEDEDMLNAEEKVESQDKQTTLRAHGHHDIYPDDSNETSSSDEVGQKRSTRFQNSDDESSTLSTPSTLSQAVTYRIDYNGDTKKTTKTIMTRDGMLSETTIIEQLDVDSVDCGLSVDSYVTE